MIDFSSALYLGFQHPSQALPPWERLTLGKPAALEEPSATTAVAKEFALLAGCERAMMAPSTLHAFLDLFEMLSTERVTLYIDSGIYAIMRWSIDRARAKGSRCIWIPHFDAAALRERLRWERPVDRAPVIVTDSFCPACGRAAPLAGYLESIDPLRGSIVMDDTQALGVLGEHPDALDPYGRGGGGSLRYHGIDAARVWSVGSLAKAFGSPVAMIGATVENIERLEEHSLTRVHCSPASAAVVHAAARSFALNRTQGDVLRRGLANLVRHFKYGLRKIGLVTTGGLFPVQTLVLPSGQVAARLQAELLRQGIHAVLQRQAAGAPAALTFLLSAMHTHRQIDRTCNAIAQALPVARDRKGVSNGSDVAV